MLRMRLMGDEAAVAAKRTLSTLSVFLGATALVAAVTIAPADAKKSKAAQSEKAVGAVDSNQPMTIIVSLRNQKASIYRGTTLVTSTRVSTGKRGYATKAGVFSILEKRRRHYSNLYAGAPMPWMQRLTWSGTALHAGVVPGYPASHGCIRLPHSFAPKLFSMTTVGGQVVIARGTVAPKLIEHAALFKPLPPPMPPMVVKEEELEPKAIRRSSIDPVPASRNRLPVVFAKAEPAGTKAVRMAEAQIAAPFVVHPAVSTRTSRPVAVAMFEDTTEHAIDPYGTPFVGSGSHGFAAKPAGDSQSEDATVGTSDDFMKHQDRLMTRAGASEAPAGPAISLSANNMTQPVATAPERALVAMKVPEPEQADEPQAGPIFNVAASAVEATARQPVSVSLAIFGFNDHPPLPPAKPSIMAAKLVAGAAAAAVVAAEPRSPEPLRVLITRRTKRDRMIGVQHILSSMGHLEPQNFDGTFGRLTARAIKSFQQANDMPETGAFTDEVVAKIYAVAGKEEPPQGHLFVRQKFAGVFDMPVHFRNPDAPLGTHVFTVMHFEPGATEAQWMAISLKAEDDPVAVLNRIVIPDNVRQNISERLTPGSSLIVADTAINSATLPKGADFLVWDTRKPAKVERASVSPKPRKKRRASTRRRTTPTYTRRYQRRNPWPF